MTIGKIQDIWFQSYQDYCRSNIFQSDTQIKASHAILRCKTAEMACNISRCSDCGHTDVHYNSCRNRNCPNCQAVKKEIWVDQRHAEVIDAPYFRVVFTLPHELNSLIYCNQKLLYGLLHRCCAETLLELSSDKKYLGATPRIIKVTENKTTFSARALHKGEPRCEITLDNTEFIQRYLMHVLPYGFQKIRYYGLLYNRMKKKNLKVIFKIQGKQGYHRLLRTCLWRIS